MNNTNDSFHSRHSQRNTKKSSIQYPKIQNNDFYEQESQNFELLMSLGSSNNKQPLIQQVQTSKKNKPMYRSNNDLYFSQALKTQPLNNNKEDMSKSQTQQINPDSQIYRGLNNTMNTRQRQQKPSRQYLSVLNAGSQSGISHKKCKNEMDILLTEIEDLKKELNFYKNKQGEKAHNQYSQEEENINSIQFQEQIQDLRQQIVDNERTYLKYIQEQQNKVKKSREEEEKVKLQLREANVKLIDISQELESQKSQNSVYLEDRKILDEQTVLITDLRDIEHKYNVLLKEDTEKTKLIENYKQRIKLQTDKIEQLNVETKSQKKTIEEQEKELNKLRNESAEFQDDKQNISQIKTQNQEYQDEIQKLNKQIIVLQQEIDDLKKQLQDTNQQMKTEVETLNKNLQETRQNYEQVSVVVQQKQEEEQKTISKIALNKNKELDEERESLYQLFQQLDATHTHFLSKLKEVDENRNQTLSEIEFQLCCQRIFMEKKYIKAICRFVGYDQEDQHKELKMSDIIDKCEGDKEINEIFEQRLFKLIIEKISEKKLSVFEFIEKCDTDDNNAIDVHDLKTGLYALKIILEEKDFNHLWKLLDKDGNGKIELIEAIQKIKNMENVKQSDRIINFEQRFHKLFRDQNQFEPNVPLNFLEEDDKQKYFIERTLGETNKTRIEPVHEYDFINGRLFIQIPVIKNLKSIQTLKQLTIRVQIRGSTTVTRNILYLDEQTVDESIIVPVRQELKENLGDVLSIQIFSSPDDFSEINYLGETQIKYKSCIEKPGEWGIYNIFPINNYIYNRESDPKECSGEIGVQCKWVEGITEDELQQIKDQPIKKMFTDTIVEDGILEVKVVRSLLKQPEKRVKCTVDMPTTMSLGETMLGHLDAYKQAYWGKKINVKINKAKNEKFKCVHIKVFSESEKLRIDEPIGEVYVDWSECTKNPYNYHHKNAFILGDQVGKIYVQYRWLPLEFAKNYEKEELIEGTLKVLAVRAKNLRADDGSSSDPFIKFGFKNYDKYLEMKTTYKGKTLNPQYNEILPMEIKFEKYGPVPPLYIEVMDHDRINDDSLGDVTIDVTKCLDEPLKWSINQIFDLDEHLEKNSNKTTKAQVYVQCYFVPKNTPDPNLKPVDIEHNNTRKPDDSVIKGKLKVKVVHAKNLKKADDTASDPYAIVLFPDQYEKTTNTISKTLNPIWNELFEHEIKIQKDLGSQPPKLPPLKIIIKDSDHLSTDDVLGTCNIDWMQCTKQPGEWVINQVMELQGTPDQKKNVQTLGYVYIQVQFVEPGMIDDHIDAPLVENLAQIIADQQGCYKGNLRVFLVSASGLVKADDGENNFSDPYVIFKAPGAKKIESSTIDNTCNPVWKTFYNVPLNMPKDQIQPMRIEVLDQDLIGKDLLGYANISLDDALKNPGKWGIDQIYDLDGGSKMKKKYNTEDFGKIYMQIMYVPVGTKNDDPPNHLKIDQESQNRDEKVEKKTPIKGVIETHIIMARGLRIADITTKTSDPYCTIEFPDDMTVSTKYKKKTLNPVWNFANRHQINILTRDYKPMKLVVKDSDKGAVDDSLGEVIIDWKECYENPTIWKVNQLFKLTGEQKYGKDLGEIYVQIRFLRSGDLEAPAQKEQLEQYMKQNLFPKTIPDLFDQYGRIRGLLKISVISAEGLPNKDTFGKTDAQAFTYISTKPGNKIKTLVIKDSLDPVWNFEGQFFINLLRCQARNVTFNTEVYDYDNLSNDFIGEIKIDLLDALERNNKYVEKVYPLTDPQSTGSKANLGSIKLGYHWVENEDCEGIQGLREPLKLVQGELFVNVVNCRNIKNEETIGKSDPFVQFTLNHEKNKKYKTKQIDNNLNPDFNHEEKINLDILEKEAQTMKMAIKVKDEGTIDTMLGGCTLDISKIVLQPGSWYNDYIQLRDNEGQLQQGYVYVQVQFRPENPENEINKTLPNIIDFDQFMQRGLPEKFPGSLILNIVGARKLQSTLTDKIDPFVEAKFSIGYKEVIKTKVIDDNEEPFWNHEQTIPLNITQEQQQNIKLSCKLYDYDFASNDLKGQYETLIQKVFEKPGEWINEIVPMLNASYCPGAGELYYQLCWVPNGTQNPPPPENLIQAQKEKYEKDQQEKQKLFAELDKNQLVGKLYLKVLNARKLLCVDSLGGKSDAFVVAKLKNGCKEVFKTKTIEDNSNPEWNEYYEFEVSILPSQAETSLLLQVFDYDYNGDDLLGYVEIKFDLLNDKCEWINNVFHILDSKGNPGKNGLLNIQTQWRKKNTRYDAQLPEPLDTLLYQNQHAPVGRFYLKIVKAESILGVEKSGKYSDAYAVVYLGENTLTNKKRKTKVIKSLNPQWDEVKKFKIKSTDINLVPPLRFEVWDDNAFGDDFLGQVELKIPQEILMKPMEYSFKQALPLNNLQLKKTKGEVTGQIHIELGFAPKKIKNKEAYQVFGFKKN